MLQENVDITNKTILITGVAGFIGSHLAARILREFPMTTVLGIDCITDSYDVSLKYMRLEHLNDNKRFIFIQKSIADRIFVDSLFNEYHPAVVVNLAAQAGVRNPKTEPYMESNIIGFYNILEACRNSYNECSSCVEHLVYASSSSVYGANEKMPYSTDDKVDSPVSFYAATKKCNEIMAYAYSKLYGVPSTGLRFFTVYGPAGRPDMAYFKFTNKLVNGETIKIYNYGECYRDFTYVDDIVEGIIRVIACAPKSSEEPYQLYNIGNGNPISVLDFVTILQEELLRAGILPDGYDFDAHKQLIGMQPGDVAITYADTKRLEEDFGIKPQTNLRDGLRKFAEWYKIEYKRVVPITQTV
jgi:nucleoside-diphosphate-sugar epimerase